MTKSEYVALGFIARYLMFRRGCSHIHARKLGGQPNPPCGNCLQTELDPLPFSEIFDVDRLR